MDWLLSSCNWYCSEGWVSAKLLPKTTISLLCLSVLNYIYILPIFPLWSLGCFLVYIRFLHAHLSVLQIRDSALQVWCLCWLPASYEARVSALHEVWRAAILHNIWHIKPYRVYFTKRYDGFLIPKQLFSYFLFHVCIVLKLHTLLWIYLRFLMKLRIEILKIKKKHKIAPKKKNK